MIKMGQFQGIKFGLTENQHKAYRRKIINHKSSSLAVEKALDIIQYLFIKALSRSCYRVFKRNKENIYNGE